MERKTFGWRDALNYTGDRIEKDGQVRDARLGIHTPRPRDEAPEPVAAGWDLWWSIALAHVFLAGLVLIVFVRSFAG